MINNLSFFYNMFVSEIRKIGDDYFFTYNDLSYVVSLYKRDIKEATYIYLLSLELIKNNLITYKIVLTKDGSCLFEADNNYYILMIIPNVENRFITLEDILSYRLTVTSKELLFLDKSNWGDLWERKIDYLEYQFKEMNLKYPKIALSINFYLGLWENAIAYYNNCKNGKKLLEVCHKRVSVKMDYLSFVNPLNMIVDTKLRDVSSFMQSYVLEEAFTKEMIVRILNRLDLDVDSCLFLISRSLFPTYFFDCYDDIIYNDVKEDTIDLVSLKYKQHLDLLKIMFNYYSKYNIDYIDWIIHDN